MKSTYWKYGILLTMIGVVFLGTRESERAPFEVAHASFSVPQTNDSNEICECVSGTPKKLLSPSTQPVNDYEEDLFRFVLSREYAKLGWCMDKRVRDTGPFAEGKNYGLHPAVRIYYSPRMMYWLTGDPKYWDWKKEGKGKKPPMRKPRTGAVPDGAIIIKEMFIPPSDLYRELNRLVDEANECDDKEVFERILPELISSYTIMVKDSKASHDGWYWSSVDPQKKGQSLEEAINTQLTTYMSPRTGTNLPCNRCHGSAATQSTFIDLKNVKGFEKEARLLQFHIDVSWKTEGLLDKYPLSKLGTLVDSDPCIKDELTVKELREMFELPSLLRPWKDSSIPGFEQFADEHLRELESNRNLTTAIPLESINPEFATLFPQISNITSEDARPFPFQWADQVAPSAGKPEHYITSDNCLGCHGGLAGVSPAVNMFILTGPKYGTGYSVSEYGEWRWSPMGLAGRDPIFYAQLESEMKFLEQDAAKKRLKGPLDKTQEAVVNTCTSCHGAMGQRQLLKDAKNNPELDPNFKIDYVYLAERLSSKDPVVKDAAYIKYGELAREGISCTVCHHINEPSKEQVDGWKPSAEWLTDKADKELAYFLFHNNTGRYEEGPADELNGPFKDVATKPMENILGVTPVHNDFTTNSQLCGGCHNINLPNIGMKENKYPVLTAAEQNPALAEYNHSIEQATFLEWQNSAFGFTVDGKKGKDFQSCQSCHMPNSFVSLDSSVVVPQITTKIATIQDQDYAEVDNILPTEDISLQARPDFKRHELVGLNVFLLEMFDQFPEILGVDKKDHMTYSTKGNEMAIENMVRQAQQNTVDLDVQLNPISNNKLPINVTVSNKTGHRFPSGVAFRRAFLEVLVLDGNQVIWGSGRTNSVGVIVDENGNPLKTEFLPDSTTYQHHYQKITEQNQVQIYEELNQNQDREFTTSFIHRVYPIKDNRLLPRGWRSAKHFKDQGELMFEFMEATDPEGDEVFADKDYQDSGEDFAGQDQILYEITLPKGVDTDNLTVRVTVYSQSIPPFWLHERFKTTPDGEATKRLFYMTSHLNLKGTAMENWKLPLVTVEEKYPKKS